MTILQILYYLLQGIRALHSPQTGIVDFAAVTRSYADNFTDFGGKIHLGFKVTGFSQSELPNFPVLINGTSSVRILVSYTNLNYFYLKSDCVSKQNNYKDLSK